MMVATMLSAQQPNIQPLPIDSAVRVGHLENGLTYYIRHNELPKQRCEFHIAQRVGAILEEDNQNGLAHFLEHMCFNGTEHFQGKGIIEYFEKQGVNFGGDINAYTSLDKTVYRLSNVPTVREGIVDSALLVLHDWSCSVSLLPEEIDAERGVIREEWRTGRTAARRMYARGQAVMFPGTKYAIRDVIGDTAVINNFAYDALRAYYKKWYGPDNQALVIVGDIDVDQIEQKIKDLWANVPARANYGERPYEVIPENEEPHIGVLTDKEQQQSVLTLIFKHAPIPNEYKSTIIGFTYNIFHELAYRIMSERLQEKMMQPDAPFIGGIMAYTNLVPTQDAFYCRLVAKDGKVKDAFHLMLTEVEKMRRYGFTEDELERAKALLTNDYEQMYNERDKTENINYVKDYLSNYLEHEPIPGIATELEIIKMMLPSIQTAQLNEVAAGYVTDKNVIAMVQAPDKEGNDLPTEAEIKDALAHRTELEIEAPKASVVEKSLIKKMPKAGKIKKVSHNDVLGTTEWTLSNGVKVILRPTQLKQDEILMNAYSWGGLSVLKQDELLNAMLAGTAAEFMGLGQFSMNDLQKMLAGKTVGLNSSINKYTEDIEGNSSVKDFETLLQLTYLGFTAPRKDAEAFASLRKILESQMKNKATNPKAAFKDSVTTMIANHSPRAILLDETTVSEMDVDKCFNIYQKRFANPADFTFSFVGNIDPEDAAVQQLICTYLGGLKGNKKKEQCTDDGVRVPAGVAKNYFTREMETKTASNRIQYTSYDIPYTLENALTVELIGMILDRRYMESIREREGGSYGVGTYAHVAKEPIDKAVLLMQFDTDPAKQPRLMEIIHEEVNTIVNNGPLADDVQKDKEILLKSHKEDLEQNSWWLSAIVNFEKCGTNLVSDYENAVNAITGEKVQAMLKQLVASGNVFEVVMLPAE